jgi:molybdopterin converting factor small subunit
MRVLLFARARDLAGAPVVEVELEPGSTVGDLRRRLLEGYPVLAGLAARSAIAVNHGYADDGLVLPANAEVALVPPVSGG